jgi:uncharacterized protein YcnI
VAYAHVTVSPLDSKAGATQNYELRVHNEAKVATASLELEIPQGVTVLDVAKPESGKVDTSKTGDRITKVTWHVEVPAGKYLALKFSAKNPTGVKEVHWVVHEKLSDGSTVEWSDKAGAKEKASVTRLATQ